MKKLEGNIVDIQKRQIYPGELYIQNGVIQSIQPNKKHYDHFIAPGFIDAHVHIESSMLTPENFSKLVISKGTIAIVNDPHEIANVLGIRGIDFMWENSRNASIKMFFTIPSCVPATPFDKGGSEISLSDTITLLNTGKFIGLSEMMNVPGVLSNDAEIIQKLELFRRRHLMIDGHAPQLNGKDLQEYIKAGISTDHECTTAAEALEKIKGGMKILIREGSAAKNYELLKSLIALYPEELMFCTDDAHPDDLIKDGHIDKIVKRAVQEGFDLFDVLRIACYHPIQHYKLPLGCLQKGDPADFVVFRDLESFETLSVYINGEEKYRKNKKNDASPENSSQTSLKNLNQFSCSEIDIAALRHKVDHEITAIGVIKDEIITQKVVFSCLPQDNLESDLNRDILKLVYLNRYDAFSSPQIAYITGVGLKEGAFATTISHDSHNIIAVGCKDQDLMKAINTVIREKGGLCVTNKEEEWILPLPIAGIMTFSPAEKVAKQWSCLTNKLKELGCQLNSPFMTLSFMALIVIPALKMGEQGLFDFSSFSFIKMKDKERQEGKL